MLKINIPKGGDGIVVNMAGTVAELTADLSIAINAVYNTLLSGPVPQQADTFRLLLLKTVIDPNSPAWEVGTMACTSTATPVSREED